MEIYFVLLIVFENFKFCKASKKRPNAYLIVGALRGLLIYVDESTLCSMFIFQITVCRYF